MQEHPLFHPYLSYRIIDSIKHKQSMNQSQAELSQNNFQGEIEVSSSQPAEGESSKDQSEQELAKMKEEEGMLLKVVDKFRTELCGYREDILNCFELDSPTLAMLNCILCLWNNRSIKSDKYLMTLVLTNVQEKMLPGIHELMRPIASIKLIVNDKVIKTEATLQMIGEQYFEGIDEMALIESMANHTLYTGQVKDKRPHGKGILQCRNKDSFKYIGEFVKGKRHGKGQLRCKLSIYVGDFADDFKHGEGEETFLKKKKKNQPQFKIVKKSQYKGMFKEGQRDGLGRENMIDVYEFEGLWKNGQKHGQGEVQYANGHHYFGNWANNEFNGHGKYIQKDNCTYEGHFLNGKYHGQGLMIYDNGDRYEGAFENGKKHGQGKYDWKPVKEGEDQPEDEDYYDGEWKNDSAEGQGTSMIGGEFYNGEFKNGKRHGEGELNTLDGDFIRAIWQNGEIKKKIEVNGEPVNE